MSKKSALIVLLVLALLLPFREVQAAIIMMDGFEDGDFTANPAWLPFSENGPSDPTINSTIPRFGSYSVRFVAPGVGGGQFDRSWLETNVTETPITWSLSFWIYFVDKPIPETDPGMVVIAGMGAAGCDPGACTMSVWGINDEGEVWPEGIGPGDAGSAYTPPLDEWHHWELLGNGTGRFFYVDDVWQSSELVAAGNVTGISLGLYNARDVDTAEFYIDDVSFTDGYQGAGVDWVTFYRYTGITQLQVNSSTIANGTTIGYFTNTLLNLNSTTDIGYDFWRYIITGASIHEMNPYTHNVTESAIVQSYASPGGGGGVTAQAMNWWLMLVGFVCFVSPPFLVAKRWYGETANVIPLLFVMVIGLALIGAAVS